MTAIATNVKNTLTNFIQSDRTKNTAKGALKNGATVFVVSLILTGGSAPIAITAAGISALATAVNALTDYIQSDRTKNTAKGALKGAAISFVVTLILTGGNVPIAITTAGLSALATTVSNLVNVILIDVFNQNKVSLLLSLKDFVISSTGYAALYTIFPQMSLIVAAIQVIFSLTTSLLGNLALAKMNKEIDMEDVFIARYPFIVYA